MNMISKLAIAAVLAGVAGSANAVTIYSENFNNAGFAGGPLGATDTSDRFGPTNYLFINNFGGWTFNSANTFLARTTDGTDGAVLINENGANAFAATTISGLTQGRQYTLSFLLSGDNRPGQNYQLTGSIDGVSILNNGTDGAPGSTSGTPVSYLFTASGSSVLLTFGQVALSEASPIIDNISVTGNVPEPATWALLLVGFGMVGVAGRRRKAVVAA